MQVLPNILPFNVFSQWHP